MTNSSNASRTCPWCAAVATDEAASCTSCGAVMAQRETLGDVAIPGVTAVHPSLVAADGRPMHLAGPSASQGMANGVMVAALIGGPVGLVALGGMAAVAAVEYAGSRREGIGSPEDLATLGRPSELALLALERAEAAASTAGSMAASTTGTPPAAPPVADPWRDLPGEADRASADEAP